IEDTDQTHITGEVERPLFKMGFGGNRNRLEIGTASATNGVKTSSNIYACIELLGFEQPVVGCVEVFAFNINTGQCQTLSGRLFDLFLRSANLPDTFPELE